MGDDARPKGPFVLNIRMSGRLVPFAAGLTLFAVLPFLGGSAANPERADVVLAAGAPADVAVQDAVGVVEAARQGLAGPGGPSPAGRRRPRRRRQRRLRRRGPVHVPVDHAGALDAPMNALATALTTAQSVVAPAVGCPPPASSTPLPVESPPRRPTHPPRARPGDVPHRHRPHGRVRHPHPRSR